MARIVWNEQPGTASTKEPALIPAGPASNPAGPWILIEALRNGALLTGQEANRVGDDAQGDRLLVNWVGFVAGAEVEDGTVAY